MTNHRIYTWSFAPGYSLYTGSVVKQGRMKAEVEAVLRCFTGYTAKQLERQLKKEVDFALYFVDTPALNPARRLITGSVCGERLTDIQEPQMRVIRYLD